MIVKPKLISRVNKKSALKDTFSNKIFTPGESISPGGENKLFKEIDSISQLDKRISKTIKLKTNNNIKKNSIKAASGIIKTSLKVTKIVAAIISSIPLILCILVAVLLFAVLSSLLPI